MNYEAIIKAQKELMTEIKNSKDEHDARLEEIDRELTERITCSMMHYLASLLGEDHTLSDGTKVWVAPAGESNRSAVTLRFSKDNIYGEVKVEYYHMSGWGISPFIDGTPRIETSSLVWMDRDRPGITFDPARGWFGRTITTSEYPPMWSLLLRELGLSDEKYQDLVRDEEVKKWLKAQKVQKRKEAKE